ncbi:MAG: DnaA/Hda family protein, partial [Planctomycetota bacterium]
MPSAAPTAPTAPATDAATADTAACLDRIRARLADELGADRVARYFDGSANITLTGSRLDVAVPTHFIADMLSRKFGDSLRRAVSAETTGQVDLRFRVDSTRTPPATSSGQPEAATQAPAKPKKPRDASRRFRFNDFVVGEANKLAYSAARALATDTDTAALSPLFVHASWGLGKTHLLQAIAAEARRPGVKVRYTTAESFTNGFVAALRNNTLDAFRATYRALDVLCIDDIHFIAGKKQTQSELLHTIDSIGMAGARIALASDGHPRDIQNLAEALSSRFLAGMVVRIDPPDEPLRVQLVLSIAARQAMHLDQDA